MRNRNKTILVTLGLATALCLIVGPAAAQGLSTSNISGTFTLPFEVQWGASTLPAGDYILVPRRTADGQPIVEVRGTAEGSLHNFIQVESYDRSNASQNMLVCMRGSNGYVVRALELPVNGQTLYFGPPKGEKVLAHQQNNSFSAQLAEVRVPVNPHGK
jgi:hypothetical protein